MTRGQSLVLVLHVATTASYAGFQLLVHLVVYRMFPLVPPDAFPAYERSHQRRITALVAVLFPALVASTGALVALRPTGTPAVALVGAVTLLGVVLASTAFGAAPQHARLGQGFDATAYAALVRADAVRSVAAVGNAALALWLAAR